MLTKIDFPASFFPKSTVNFFPVPGFVTDTLTPSILFPSASRISTLSFVKLTFLVNSTDIDLSVSTLIAFTSGAVLSATTDIV